MRNAKKANGSKNVWLPEFVPNGTDKIQGQDIINLSGRCYSQAGANRQGFATWGLATEFQTDVMPTPQSLTNYLSPRNNTSGDVNPSYFYKYFGLPSNGMITNYFGDDGLTDDVRNFLNSTEFKKDLTVDLRTNINSRYSVHTYFNAMKITDVNIKLYICRFKKMHPISHNIWIDICSWGNSDAETIGHRIPKVSMSELSNDASRLGENQNLNYFDIETAPISYGLPDGDNPKQNERVVEVSSVLGLTPGQSIKFKQNWEVLDVIDNKLAPNDCWEFNLEEKYNKGFSIREMSAEFGGFSKSSQNEDYSPLQRQTTTGDIVIVPVFSGSPSGNFEIKSGADSVSEVMPVDSAPARIRHTVRHGINISWPKAIDIRTLDTTQQSNWENQGWSIVTQRMNNTNRANFPFGYEDSRIRIMTQNLDEAGGEKSPLS
jgi:hypothetical protein